MSRPSLLASVCLYALAGALLVKGTDLPGRISGRPTVIENPASWDDGEASVPVSSLDPMWGSRVAPVTIVLFSDYRCPYCKQLEDTIREIEQEYGPHKVRVVFKHAPIVHRDARPAHEAAAKVFAIGGADAFWAFHRLAFENNGSLGAENLEAWAKKVGVDASAFRAEGASQAAAQHVSNDLALASKLGVRGTPMAFVNGILVRGYVAADAYRSVIEKELAAAEALVAEGTPPDRVYVVRSQVNRPDKSASKEETPAAKDPAGEDATPPPPKKDRGAVQEDDPTVFRASAGASPVRGPKSAPVTIVELASFDCRFSSLAEETLREILASYKDDVRLVYKHRMLPYLKRGLPAALLAELARAEKGDEGFWAAHDALFKAEQEANDRGGDERLFNQAQLVSIGTTLGLDEAKVRAVLTDANLETPAFEPGPAAKKYLAAIEADAELADTLDAEPTPHFFINGRRLVGAQGADKFRMLIDEELKKAKAKIAAGTSPDGLYEAIMKDAVEPAAPPVKLIDPAPGAPSRGKPDAKVQLHVFSDFECQFCKQSEATLAMIEKAYADKVTIVWRDRPLPKHTTAPLAANAAREALAQKGNEGFFAFHDELFKLTRTPEFNRAGFERIAEQQGLDMAAFKAALDGKAHQKAIDADVKTADAAGINGTPSFVFTFGKKDDKLEGFVLSGALPPSRFRRAFRLAFAVASGTTKAPEPDGAREAPPSVSDPIER